MKQAIRKELSLLVVSVIMIACLLISGNAATQASLTSPAPAQITITPTSSQQVITGAPERFTGSVSVQSLFDAKEPMRSSAAQVTFQPGARTAWHTHPLGQVLIVTDGVG